MSLAEEVGPGLDGLEQLRALMASIGRRAAFAEASLADSNGRLYASATSTLLIFDRPVVQGT